jgi:eukaryotic-like serine/threonine-protein kinase
MVKASIFKNLVQGLIHIHQAGTVHRDIKLENIMIELPGDDGLSPIPKLIDFGLSTVLY